MQLDSPQYKILDKCRLSNSSNIKTVMQFPATPVGDAYLTADELDQEQPMFPLSLQLCLDSGHLQIGEVVEPDVLYGKFTYRTAVSLGLVEHFKGYAETVLNRFKPNAESFILDIGSNDGSLLQFFQEKNIQVLGIDPATAVAQEANEKGVETWPTYFNQELAEKIKTEKGQADIVVSNNTFANIDDLRSFFVAIQSVMKEDGVFIFETGYALDLAKNMVFDNIYHEHLSYFLVNPLKQFFQSMGMCLFDIERIDTKGGSLRGYVCNQTRQNISSDAVEALCLLEEERGISKPDTFVELNNKIDQVRTELHRLFKDYKAAGKTVAAYGASVGITTMLYHLGLEEYIDYLVDENPLKHGLYSPGLKIPVYSNAELTIRQPDCVVILAWRYADAIIAKNPDYLKQGGEFITPIPFPKSTKKNS